MSFNAKVARLATGFSALLLIGWSARSTYQRPEGGYGFVSNSGPIEDNGSIHDQHMKLHDVFSSTTTEVAIAEATTTLPPDAKFGLPVETDIAEAAATTTTEESKGKVDKGKEPAPFISGDDTAGASAPDQKLGMNGRPKLPPQEMLEEHYPEPQDDGSHLNDEEVGQYVNSCLDAWDTKFWRMECPGQFDIGKRYEVLKQKAQADPKIKYLFALDLYNSIEILPRLMSTIVQVIKFLGPEHCGLSIIEGRSGDGTYKVLHGLHSELHEMGVHYWLNQSDIDPHAQGKDRIAELSKLRNMAIEPSWKEEKKFSEEPLIMFINDIAVCPDDILEMMYQHMLQNATQTCAMDWVEGGDLFYDVWVSRSMSGNTFFEIPQDMSWAFSRNMFWDEPIGKDKYARNKPLQVFSCWGGMVVLDALPFMTGQLEFRRNADGECYGGEPQTLASDLTKLGLNKVQTLPYVHVAYNNHEGAHVKGLRGYVHRHVNTGEEIKDFKDDKSTERIKWKKPPPRYRCMPSFVDQWWVESVYVPEEEQD